MKKVLALTAAAALAAFALPANAATDLGTTDLTGDDLSANPNLFFAQFDFGAPEGSLTADPSGFSKTYTFLFPSAGSGAGSATASLVGGPNTLFTSITLNGTFFDLTNGNTQGNLTNALVNAGLNTLKINFDVTDVNRIVAFNGDVSAAAVPEPATWALMILGFGLVGGTLRRRQKTAVRYA